MGTLRFFMASCVVLFHLTERVQNIGILAVVFFYSISGYLISLVLHETYRFRAGAFAKNRFLRLYPAYLAILLLGFGASWLPSFSSFHPAWSQTGSMLDFLGNLLIFPWGLVAGSNIAQYRIVPTSWSVGVELCCYALLWLVTARSWKLAATTAMVATAWYLLVECTQMSPSMKYYPVPAAMLPFSLGALAYFISNSSPRLTALSANAGVQRFGAFACILCFLAIWSASVGSSQVIFDHWAYYANIGLAFLTVLFINRARVPGKLGQVDKFLGDLAYPIFLGHFVYGVILWKLLHIESRGWVMFGITYPVTICISIVITRYIDEPINRLRSGVRQSVIMGARPET